MLRRMRRTSPLAVAIAFAIAACANAAGTDPPTTTAGSTVSPSVSAPLTTAAPTTPETTTHSGSSTTSAGVPDGPDVASATGLGDSRYPELGNVGIDVDHYIIELRFDPGDGSIDAVATVEATATDDLEVFSLDFIGYDVSAVTVDGAAAAISRTDTKLVVAPATAIPTGEGFSVAVAYTGTPQPFQPEGMPFQMGWMSGPRGEQFVAAEPDAARTWFPGNDHPVDKATFTFRVTVPDPLMAVANGVLTDTVEDGDDITRVFEMDQPMPTYLATVVIGDYTVVDDPDSTGVGGVPIRNLLPPGLTLDPPPRLDLQGEMMAFMVDRFGPYPFDLYGIAVVPGFPAALENSTLSLFGDRIVASIGFFEAVLVHELAHQWFGNHVTLGDWGDIWLNEGFATYAEWLWIEERDGPEALRVKVEEQHANMSLLGLPPPGNPPADDLFNASVYITGGLTLHALRLEIGDDAFFETLRTYLERFAYGTAYTADFIAVAEEMAGRDLTDLFDAWLYGDEVPDL